MALLMYGLMLLVVEVSINDNKYLGIYGETL